MNRFTNLLRLAPRAAFFAMVIAAPLAAVPQVNAGYGVTIDAPAQAKTGAGLVLLVSLQRAR